MKPGRLPAEPASVESLQILARGSLLTVGGMIASALLGITLAIIVTRSLGAHGAGMFLQLVAIFSILVSLTEFGTGPALVRSISQARTRGSLQDVRRVTWIAAWPVIALSAASGVVLVVVAPPLARMLGLPADSVPALRMLAPFIPLGALTSVALSVTRGLGTVTPHVAVEHLAKPGLRPLMVLGALFLGFGPLGVIVAWAIPTAVLFPAAFVAMFALMRRHEGALSSPEPSHASARGFWLFAAPRGVAVLLHTSLVWLDVILLGALASTEEAGIYGAVGRLALVGSFAMEAVRLVIAPQFSTHLARGDRRGAQDLYRTGTTWVVVASWPFYLTLGLFAPVVLQMFGAEFVRGQSVLVILSAASLLGMAVGNVSVMLLMAGKSMWNLLNTAAALVVNVGLNLVLISRFGMLGAAFAWATSAALMNVIPLVQIRRHLGMTPFGPSFRTAVAASVGCYGVVGFLVRALLGPTVPALILFAIVATGLYVVTLFRFRETLQLRVLTGAVGSWLSRTGSIRVADTPTR